jgi:hypothetical protein
MDNDRSLLETITDTVKGTAHIVAEGTNDALIAGP